MRFFFISMEYSVAALLASKGHKGSPFGAIKGAKKEDGKKNMEVNSILKLSGLSFVYCKIPAEAQERIWGNLLGSWIFC